MANYSSFENTRKGWLFCLNAPLEPGKGSNWGYLDYFYRYMSQNSDVLAEMATVRSTIWGKPCGKDLRLQPGDGLVFFHGKKARVSSTDGKRKRHVKPYQMSLLAIIDDIRIEEDTREVKEIAFTFPEQLLEAMEANPLTQGRQDIKDIVDGAGLGAGPVGTFYPIDPDSWRQLTIIAIDQYGNDASRSLREGEFEAGRNRGAQLVDQFESINEEVKKRISEVEQFQRSPTVRQAVLERANGACEWCGEIGFTTRSGAIYLETHHIIPLSEGGMDHPRNVIGLCPKHHRESHYGKQTDDLRKLMEEKIGNLNKR